MKAELTPMRLDIWIDRLQASGRYSFQRSEAMTDSGLSPEAVSKALQRAVKRGRVVKLNDYFYVIVPLEYASAGSPPVSWFVGDLMTAIGLPYYVGFLSAAALHGASHQQPQQFQIVTDRSVRLMIAGRNRLRFFASKYITGAATEDMKAPTGPMRVSTLETTIVDLVRFARSAGGLDNVATVIAELSADVDPRLLLAAVRLVNDVPNAQRLGYLLDHVKQRRLSDSIYTWLERKKPRILPLRSGQPVNDAKLNRRWNLLVNRPVEVEA